MFLIAVLRDEHSDLVTKTRQAGDDKARGGVTRTGLVLKQRDLFYNVSVDEDSIAIPCGRIVVK